MVLKAVATMLQEDLGSQDQDPRVLKSGLDPIGQLRRKRPGAEYKGARTRP